MKTVNITDLGKHHSGTHNGYKVESTCLENCKRICYTKKEAIELAEYWEAVALSQYH